MKRTFIIALIGALGTAVSARADNPTIEKALAKRPELSGFYQALMNTGVNKELKAGRSYTVFAPVNGVFAQMPEAQYPCLYNESCMPQVADIVRNHIVPGEIHMEDAATNKGGVYSIDKRFVAIGEPSRNNYAVEGHRVLSSNQIGAHSMIHKIDGIIARPNELASLQYPQYASAPGQISTVTQEFAQPSPCLQDGCPQSIARTTTTTIIGPVSYNAE